MIHEDDDTAPSPDVMRAGARGAPSGLARTSAHTVKVMGNDLHAFMSRLPPSREISTAKTKLEEAVMWAVKGITA